MRLPAWTSTRPSDATAGLLGEFGGEARTLSPQGATQKRRTFVFLQLGGVADRPNRFRPIERAEQSCCDVPKSEVIQLLACVLDGAQSGL